MFLWRCNSQVVVFYVGFVAVFAQLSYFTWVWFRVCQVVMFYMVLSLFLPNCAVLRWFRLFFCFPKFQVVVFYRGCDGDVCWSSNVQVVMFLVCYSCYCHCDAFVRSLGWFFVLFRFVFLCVACLLCVVSNLFVFVSFCCFACLFLCKFFLFCLLPHPPSQPPYHPQGGLIGVYIYM